MQGLRSATPVSFHIMLSLAQPFPLNTVFPFIDLYAPQLSKAELISLDMSRLLMGSRSARRLVLV